ncbi:hypothetical protein BDA99DRAFT_580886 [Phascolomyces articulosus]|uniref:Rhomboid-type serine protease n=1 Tax=Phascolomyces articulosus TaxID=60185 RepID=A0AAD5K9S9_9FUNG|nr:hypothetical protein BDA99DRAFT_580886 [Phascolomyces articulosus]
MLGPDPEKTKEYTRRPSFLYYGKTTDPVKQPNLPSNNNNNSSVLNIPCCQNNINNSSFIDPSSSGFLSWCHPQQHLHNISSSSTNWERATKILSTNTPSDIYHHPDDEEQCQNHHHRSLRTISTTSTSGGNDGRDWCTIFFKTGLAPVTREHQWPVVFTYIIMIFMFAIMSGEFMMNRELSGEFFEFDPFNPMLGPSTQTLIQSGARYIPCMKATTAMPPDEQYVLTVRTTCSLQDVCGMGGFLMDHVPDQGFRFITPLFVHSGLVQLGCNMIGHVLLAARLERVISSLNVALVFFVSGIFGNLFGANFSPITSQSVGCSSAVLGMIACLFIDLILTWKRLVQPVRHLAKLIILTAFCFTLGLLPGADNYSDIGGFVAGLLLGIIVVPPLPRIGRKGIVCLWIARLLALAGLITLFIIMSNRFYAVDEPDEFCPYCRYISCLPVRGFCDSSDI